VLPNGTDREAIIAIGEQHAVAVWHKAATSELSEQPHGVADRHTTLQNRVLAVLHAVAERHQFFSFKMPVFETEKMLGPTF